MAKDSSPDGTVKQDRLSLPLSEDGQLDWKRVRGTTAKKLLELLQRDSKLAAEFDEARGINRNGNEELPELFAITEENVHSILDGIAKVNAQVFQFVSARWIKHPLPMLQGPDGKRLPLILEPDILEKMAFTEKQHAELDPRALKVAKRYEGKMPDWLRKHFDLYMLCTMFVAYSAENAKTVLTAQVQRDFTRVQNAFAHKKAEDIRTKSDSDKAAAPRIVPANTNESTNGEDKNPPPEFQEPSTPGETPIV